MAALPKGDGGNAGASRADCALERKRPAGIIPRLLSPFHKRFSNQHSAFGQSGIAEC
jgi:hypothetical protein